VIFPLVLLGACTQFPVLDDSVPDALARAEYPDLVPLDPLLAGLSDAPANNAQIEANLQGRVAALRARAARLRGPIVDSATRARMRAGVRVR
jgi:hypothetical protein